MRLPLALSAALALALATCPAAAQARAPGGTALPDPASLPLVEVPAARPGGHLFAFILTGDGDWAAYIRGVADSLAAHGIASVALKSRSYLAVARTPEQVAAAAEAVLRRYLPRTGRDQVLLVGYSRGAEIVPFVANRLPADLRAKVRMLAILSPSTRASFEFHALDLFRDTRRPTDRATLPEVLALRGTPMLCMYGRDEADSLCPAAPGGLMRVVARKGGHRTEDSATASAAILDQLRALHI